MTNKIKQLALWTMAIVLGFGGCKKDEYSFGSIKTPTNLSLDVTIEGADATNPAGNGSGKIKVTAASDGALAYNFDLGDSTANAKQASQSGILNYKYNSPGTFDYTVSVTAVGTGGAVATISKKVTIKVIFEVPTAIITSLTNNASRVWITDKTATGHVGVGPVNEFTPSYYAASPNSRAACLYDDEITIAKDANNNMTINVDNKGASFIIAAATSSYGLSGGDDCYPVSIIGVKKLTFMDATSTSTTANSTRIQFTVPGDGLVNFGTGGKTYEILSITDSTMQLRNIGADGLAWYQKLKVK